MARMVALGPNLQLSDSKARVFYYISHVYILSLSWIKCQKTRIEFYISFSTFYSIKYTESAGSNYATCQC